MDFSSLGISVDSSSTKQAATDLDALAAASGRAEVATKKYVSAAEQLAAAQKQLDNELKESTLSKEYDKTVAALNRYNQAIGKTFEQRVLSDAQEKFGQGARLDNIKSLIAEIEANKQQAATLGKSSEAMAGATHVTAGFTRELVVLGHEAINGNFSRLPGSMVVLAERSGNLGTIVSAVFSGMGVAILGAVAAVGALGYGLIKGYEETQAFTKAIILSGNQAGVTSDQLAKMAQSAGQATGRIHETAAALVLMVASGHIASGSLQDFAKTAVDTQHLTGEAVVDTVKKFNELAKDPVKSSRQLDETMGYLTITIYNQIKALEEHGRKTEAAALAQKAFNDAQKDMNTSIEANKGTLEHFWDGFVDGAKRAKDWLLSIGRDTPKVDLIGGITNQINVLDSKIALLKSNPQLASVQASSGGLSVAQLETLRQQLEVQRSAIGVSKRSSEVNAELKESQNQVNKAYFESSEVLEKYKTKQEKWLQVESQLKKAFEDQAKGGTPVSNSRQLEILAEERKKIFGDTSKPETGLDIAKIKEKYQALIEVVQNGEKITAALHAAGVIDDLQAFDAKKVALEKTAALEQQELAAENARLAFGARTAAQRIENEKKIEENKTKAHKIALDVETQEKIIDIQKGDRIRQLAKVYEEAQIASDNYLASLRRQMALGVQTVGLGTMEAQQLQQQAAIEEKAIKKLEELEVFRRAHTVTGINDSTGEKFQTLLPQYQREYDERKRIIMQERDEEVQITKDGAAAKLEAEQSWINGASAAFQNMHDNAMNIAKATENAITNMVTSITDAFENFITTGKLDWKGLADSIVKDILRVIVQAQELQAMNALGLGGSSGAGGGLLQSFAGLFGMNTPQAAGAADFAISANSAPIVAGALATGGPADAGGLYRVNEQGPELLTVNGNTFLMMGSQGGFVTPNNQMGGSTHVINFYNNGPIDRRTQMQLGAEVFKQGRIAASRNG